MKTMSLKSKIVTALITGGLVLSYASLTFAASNPTEIKKHIRDNQTYKKIPLEAKLKTAVSSKIITEDESKKILAFVNSKTNPEDKTAKKNTRRHNLFKDLVDNNIITQAKADALKSSLMAQMHAERQKKLETKLKTLVTDQTITEEQSTKIKATINTAQIARIEAFDKIKTMTEEQRKAYIDEMKNNHADPLKSLVDNGAITQSQADKTNSVLHNSSKCPGCKSHNGKK